MSSEAKVSYDLIRFTGVKRDYAPEEVERLRGSIKIEYSMCNQQSIKLWELLNTETYLNTLEDSGWYILKVIPYVFDPSYNMSYNYYIFRRSLE